MKVVVAIDDSPYSAAVLDAVTHRRWPRDVQFKIVTVVEPLKVFPCDCACQTRDTLNEINHKRKVEFEKLAEKARHRLEKAIPDAIVHFELPEGNPQDEIVKSALDWDADRILIGAHGRGPCPHFLMGSVSRSVAKGAHCTVEIIKQPEALTA